MTVLAHPRAHLDPACAVPDLQDVYEDAIRSHPRSLQVALGPSEIGCGCDPCLITMLARIGQDVEEYPAWLPTIGTAVHEWAEVALIRHLATTGTDRWLPEGKVTVGQVAGVDITGHSDVFDTHTGTVVDLKVVGTTTLRSCKKGGAKTTYRNQVQLYGKGWEAAGYDVRSVAIWYLPRNGFTIGAGYLHQEPYDPAVANQVLARADLFAAAVATLGAEQLLAMAPPHTGEEFGCPSDKPTPSPEEFLTGPYA